MIIGKYFINIIIISTFCYDVIGQKQYNIWYFGGCDIFEQTKVSAGVNFNSDPPIPLLDNKIISSEGAATYCDCFGQLLFYSDGVNVWDRSHNIMLNGTNLGGTVTTTQNSIFLPFFEDVNKYFLFTNDGFNSGNGTGLFYSIIDMSLNGGLGAVSEAKRVPVLSRTNEFFTATKHANGKDYWVIISLHDEPSQLYAFWINNTGIVQTVVSVLEYYDTVSSPYYNGVGILKVSPLSDKVVLSYQGAAQSHTLFDFNNLTGVLSNPMTISSNTILWVGGASFSPNGKLLYTIENDSVVQYKLDTTDIMAGKQNVAKIDLFWADMQIAPNGKIYIGGCIGIEEVSSGAYLDVIDSPDVEGIGCNYISRAIDLMGRYGYHSLPNIITSFLLDEDSIPCIENDVYLYISNSFSPNNDGFNDVFKIDMTYIAHAKLSIFNRLGKKLFESSDGYIVWDGYDNMNRKVGKDVYMYTLEGKFLNGVEIYQKGNITVVE